MREPRLATEADTAAMAALGRSIWPEDYIAADPSRYLADGEVVLIEDEQGLAAMGKWEMLPDASGWISGLRVRGDLQGKGYGRKLLDTLLERAQKGHALTARMLVGDPNTRSLSLAASRGFKPAAHWGMLVAERGTVAAPADAPALVPAGAVYSLEGEIVLRAEFYMRALEATAKVLIAFAQAGRWRQTPEGTLVLHQVRDGPEGAVEYFQLFEPTPTVAAAIAASVAASQPHRAAVLLPWEKREGAEAFLALGFKHSSWAWGAQVLERPLR
ncbi:MAG TPA: GNAT family N-acetyltransferase [Candidatus Thermoplasmatota archaeon]|nr:GNAT family N-acetyltransferase [Candidatus Thermoplasmatota archaeon]